MMQLQPRSWATALRLRASTMTCTLMSGRPKQQWMPCRPGGSTYWPSSSLSLLRHQLRREAEMSASDGSDTSVTDV